MTQRPPQLPGGQKTKNVGVTATILAGMMIFFMFFGASNVARTILTEDRAGTLPRLFTTPTSRQTIIGGKFVSVYLTVTVQAVVLLIAGRVIFSIAWGRLDAVTALTLVGAAVSAGLALLVISLVRTPAQSGAIGSGVYLVLALLGGNFTGTASVGGTSRHRAEAHSQRLATARLGHGDARWRSHRHLAEPARAAGLRARLLRRRGLGLSQKVRVRLP